MTLHEKLLHVIHMLKDEISKTNEIKQETKKVLTKYTKEDEVFPIHFCGLFIAISYR